MRVEIRSLSGVRDSNELRAPSHRQCHAKVCDASMQMPAAAGWLRTAVHDAVAVEVWNKAMLLSQDHFFAGGDVASSVIVGPRGIGKTTALRTCGAAVRTLFPNVIPIYIDFSRRDTYHLSLNELIADALASHGIVVSPNHPSLPAALEAAEKYALLLIDELNSLYEHPLAWTHKLWHSPQVRTLLQLAELGDSRDGRFATVLCGSSAMLMALVSASAKTSDDAQRLFPQLATAVNLNDSKFRAHRLRCGAATDVERVGHMLGCTGSAAAWSTRELATVRTIAFAAGNTASAINQLVSSATAGSVPTAEALLTAHSPSRQRKLVLNGSQQVWQAVMLRLWYKNQSIMSSLLADRHGSLDVKTVQATDWSSHFLPVNAAALSEISCRLLMSDEQMYYRLIDLHDRGWLSFDYSPEYVYPRSLWQLLCFKHEWDEPGEAESGRGRTAAGAAALSAALSGVNYKMMQPLDGHQLQG